MARQVPSGTCFRSLATFEMKGLAALDLFHGITESARGQLIKIAAIGTLFLIEHSTLSGTNGGARQLSTF